MLAVVLYFLSFGPYRAVALRKSGDSIPATLARRLYSSFDGHMDVAGKWLDSFRLGRDQRVTFVLLAPLAAFLARPFGSMTDPDELETRWPRVLGRFVSWGIAGRRALRAQHRAGDVGARASRGRCLLTRFALDRVDSLGQLSSYYRRWAQLPGGIRDRPASHGRAPPRHE